MISKEQSSFIKKITSKVGKTIKQNKLIVQGDKVLLGLSGGKDSLVLLDILIERLKFLPITYQIIPVHIVTPQLGHLADLQYLKQFCQERSLQLIIENIDVDFDSTTEKKACFICSWNRRKTLFQLMKKLNCNKLAMGHHMDDAIETLLMNMTFKAEISAFPAKLLIKKGDFHIIRPLLNCTESEIQKYADIKQFQLSDKKCPYEQNNKRAYFKKKVEEICSLHKLARVNLFNSMRNVINGYLPE